MKEHFCPAEQSTITYQGECSWCGESEGSMTQDEIMEMARQAGFYIIPNSPDLFPKLEAFYKLAVAKEREACAKLIDELVNEENSEDYRNAANWCSVRIRARGEQA